MKEKFLFPKDIYSAPVVSVSEISDRAFEIAVYQSIKRDIDSQIDNSEDVFIELTKPSGDRGRDIVVKNYTGNNILGLSLTGDNKPKSIYVECKITKKKRLTLEHVANSIVQLEPEQGSIFLLVTNATLTPRALSIINEQCTKQGISFLLIDAWNINQCIPNILTKDKIPYGDYSTEKLFISYQILRDGYLKDTYIIYFLFRTMPNKICKFKINFHSKRDWVYDNNGEEFDLNYGGIGCWSAKISSASLKPPKDFNIAITIDDDRTLHKIKLISSDEIAKLPLFKSQMSECLLLLKKKLFNNTLPKLIHIHGNSGLGKSRLLQELFEEARMQGIPCRFIKILNDGGLTVTSYNLQKPDKSRSQLYRVIDFFKHLSKFNNSNKNELILIDDIHFGETYLFQEIISYTFSELININLIVAGKRNTTFRYPAYESFERKIRDHNQIESIEQIVLKNMLNVEFLNALDSLFIDKTPSFPIFEDKKSKLRPVDIVHAVHSLMERNYVFWSDEEHLSISSKRGDSTDYFSKGEVLDGILSYRYQHLIEIDLNNFKLAGFFEVLSVINETTYSYYAISKLLKNTSITTDLLVLWFEIDDSNQKADFRHNSLRDFLAKKFYSFTTSPKCKYILDFINADKDIRKEKLAAFAFSDGDMINATSLITPFAFTLKKVTNISSLNLKENDYQHLITLLSILIKSNYIRPLLTYKCVVARAYLNSHHRTYALGFIDNLRITNLINGLPELEHRELVMAAVKQLMAHALINSGDTRTAMSLMHEVENFLEKSEKSKTARTIEFDMCDRLQSYYSQNSSFKSAQMFFFRARKCAHLTGEDALLNLSFSSEFHLSRYLDVQNALMLADRQQKYARIAAPQRTLYHAKVNYIVAKWTMYPDNLKDSKFFKLKKLRSKSESKGFGHLVPRLDYLIAVKIFIDWRKGNSSEVLLIEQISKGNDSARQYGYEDFVWLFESLELLRIIECNESHELITRKAAWLIDHLYSLGLTFIAGDELCFQNTVVLSNALKALHEYSDQKLTWKYAKKISFSPLFIPKPKDQVKRLESVFNGGMLNNTYDPMSLILNNRGYAIILV